MRQRFQILFWVPIVIVGLVGLFHLLSPPPAAPSAEEVLENSRRSLEKMSQVLRDIEQSTTEIDRQRNIDKLRELIELK